MSLVTITAAAAQAQKNLLGEPTRKATNLADALGIRKPSLESQKRVGEVKRLIRAGSTKEAEQEVKRRLRGEVKRVAPKKVSEGELLRQYLKSSTADDAKFEVDTSVPRGSIKDIRAGFAPPKYSGPVADPELVETMRQWDKKNPGASDSKRAAARDRYDRLIQARRESEGGAEQLQRLQNPVGSSFKSYGLPDPVEEKDKMLEGIRPTEISNFIGRGISQLPVAANLALNKMQGGGTPADLAQVVAKSQPWFDWEDIERDSDLALASRDLFNTGLYTIPVLGTALGAPDMVRLVMAFQESNNPAQLAIEMGQQMGTEVNPFAPDVNWATPEGILRGVQRTLNIPLAVAQLNDYWTMGKAILGKKKGIEVPDVKPEADEAPPMGIVPETIEDTRNWVREQAEKALQDEADLDADPAPFDLEKPIQEQFPNISKVEPEPAPTVADSPPLTPDPDPRVKEPVQRMVNVEDVDVDPRLQYKQSEIADIENQVSSKLKDVDVYDLEQGSSWTLWERADGKIFAVNSHHRRELARRASRFVSSSKKPGTQVDINRQVPAVILREADGFTIEEARRFGALENMRDNKGTAFDAVSVMKEIGLNASNYRAWFKQNGVNFNERLTRDIGGLMGLNESALSYIRTGKLPETFVAGVGSRGLDDLTVNKILERAIARDDRPATYAQGQAWADVAKGKLMSKAAPEQDGFGLFGDDSEFTATLENLDVEAAILQGLQKRIASTRKDLVDLPSELFEGEKLDVEGRQAKAAVLGESNKQATDSVLYVSQRDPGVQSKLDELAKRVVNGEITEAEAIRSLEPEVIDTIGRVDRRTGEIRPRGAEPQQSGQRGESGVPKEDVQGAGAEGGSASPESVAIPDPDAKPSAAQIKAQREAIGKDARDKADLMYQARQRLKAAEKQGLDTKQLEADYEAASQAYFKAQRLFQEDAYSPTTGPTPAEVNAKGQEILDVAHRLYENKTKAWQDVKDAEAQGKPFDVVRNLRDFAIGEDRKYESANRIWVKYVEDNPNVTIKGGSADVRLLGALTAGGIAAAAAPLVAKWVEENDLEPYVQTGFVGAAAVAALARGRMRVPGRGAIPDAPNRPILPEGAGALGARQGFYREGRRIVKVDQGQAVSVTNRTGRPGEPNVDRVMDRQIPGTMVARGRGAVKRNAKRAADQADQIVNMFPKDVLGDAAVSISENLGLARGLYLPTQRMIALSAMLKGKPQANRVLAHEVGHYLHDYLPDEVNLALRKQFRAEQATTGRQTDYRWSSFEEWVAENLADMIERDLNPPTDAWGKVKQYATDVRRYGQRLGLPDAVKVALKTMKQDPDPKKGVAEQRLNRPLFSEQKVQAASRKDPRVRLGEDNEAIVVQDRLGGWEYSDVHGRSFTFGSQVRTKQQAIKAAQVELAKRQAGKPVEMYHSTPESNIESIGKQGFKPSENGEYGPGVYLADGADADTWNNLLEDGESARRTIEVSADLGKSAYVYDREVPVALQGAVKTLLDDPEFQPGANKLLRENLAIAQAAKGAGYDSLIVRHKNGASETIVFDPAKVTLPKRSPSARPVSKRAGQADPKALAKVAGVAAASVAGVFLLDKAKQAGLGGIPAEQQAGMIGAISLPMLARAGFRRLPGMTRVSMGRFLFDSNTLANLMREAGSDAAKMTGDGLKMVLSAKDVVNGGMARFEGTIQKLFREEFGKNWPKAKEFWDEDSLVRDRIERNVAEGKPWHEGLTEQWKRVHEAVTKLNNELLDRAEAAGILVQAKNDGTQSGKLKEGARIRLANGMEGEYIGTQKDLPGMEEFPANSEVILVQLPVGTKVPKSMRMVSPEVAAIKPGDTFFRPVNRLNEGFIPRVFKPESFQQIINSKDKAFQKALVQKFRELNPGNKLTDDEVLTSLQNIARGLKDEADISSFMANMEKERQVKFARMEYVNDAGETVVWDPYESSWLKAMTHYQYRGHLRVGIAEGLGTPLPNALGQMVQGIGAKDPALGSHLRLAIGSILGLGDGKPGLGDTNARAMKIADAEGIYSFFTKLTGGTTAVSQVSDLLQVASETGIRNTGKALWKALTDGDARMDAALKSAAEQSFYVDEMGQGMEIGSTAQDWYRRGTAALKKGEVMEAGRNYANAVSRTLLIHAMDRTVKSTSMLAAQADAAKLLAKLKAGKALSQAEARKLKRYNLDPSDARAGIEDPKVQEKLAGGIRRTLQYQGTADTVPLWAMTPAGKVAWRFKKPIYFATKFLVQNVWDEALDGNYKPLLRMAALSGAAGVATILKDAVRGGKDAREDTFFNDQDLDAMAKFLTGQKDPWKDAKYMRSMGDLLYIAGKNLYDAGAFGLMGELSDYNRRAKELGKEGIDIVEVAVPPSIDSLANLVRTVVKVGGLERDEAWMEEAMAEMQLALEREVSPVRRVAEWTGAGNDILQYLKADRELNRLDKRDKVLAQRGVPMNDREREALREKGALANRRKLMSPDGGLRPGVMKLKQREERKRRETEARERTNTVKPSDVGFPSTLNKNLTGKRRSE